MLSLWAKTSGTWINAIAILMGTGLGLGLRHRLSPPMLQIITQALGLLTLVLGFTLTRPLFEVQAGPVDGVILALLGMVAGGLLGEWANIEGRLTQLGDALKRRVRGEGQFTEGLVAASLLFCIGPMAIVGSLNNGLAADASVLTIKATMDGLASIAFAGSYGVGVAFACVPVVVVQGSLSLLAGGLALVMADPATNPYVLLSTGIGGLMIFGIGFGLLEMAQVRVASFLPALVLGPLALGVVRWLGNGG